MLQNKKERVLQESRGSSCRKTRTENSINIKKNGNNNIGIYNILQKANALKS
jgi:hypothetical protein